MKNLKIRFVAPLAFLMVCLITVASQAQSKAQLVGNWKGADVKITPLKKGEKVNPKILAAGKKEVKSNRSEIKADGTITMTNSYQTKSGKWYFKGGYLSTSLSKDKFKVSSLGDGKLALKGYLSMRTGALVDNPKDADFEVVYIYTKN